MTDTRNLASCGSRLQRAIPPTNTRPIRVFNQDESRVGRLSIRRRRLTARGVQPVGRVQHVFQAWLQFPTLDVQQDYIAHLLRGDETTTLQALTSYPSLLEAIHALCA